MFVSDDEVKALRAEVERAKKELERTKWENELQIRGYEAESEWLQYEAELEGLQPDRMGMPMFPKYEAEMEWLRYGAELGWIQLDRMGMPMFPLSEGPQQLAPTAALAVEVTTDTRVFPDTAAPDSSVVRATTKLTSAARPSSKISGERRASTGTLFPLAIRYHNNSSSSSNNIISSTNKDTTTTCAVALLRPFDPGKGCQRDARIRTVIGLDLPFDRGKA